MRHRLLGPTGLRVSDIALGTLNFGENKPWGASAETALEILGTFAEAGGTFIDTAPNYAGGAAEEIVGAFVAPRRDAFVVATKYTANASGHVLAGGNSARTMIRSVEDSLRRLKTDYVDLLWLHYWDGTTPMAEVLKGFETLIAAGKIRYAGFSDTPAWLVSRAVTMADLRGWSMPAAIQLEYSLAARDAERDLLPMAEALGLGAVCWGPMAAGALAGGADPQRRGGKPLPPDLARITERVAEVARTAGTGTVDLALGWLMQREGGAGLIPLVGARNADQMRQTLRAAESVIDEAVLAELSAATAPRLGFPHDLIASSYLRRLALGDAGALRTPTGRRA